MSAADDALAALVGVLGDIETGALPASDNDREVVVNALDVLATLGDEER